MTSHLISKATERGNCPLRVAIVHYRDSAMAGGSLRVGETIANNLDPRRVAAEIVFAYGNAGPVAKTAKVPCHFIAARSAKDPAGWLRARALFNKLRPDIIHFQDGVVWLRTALTGSSYKTLLHLHGRQTRISRRPGKPGRMFKPSPLVRAFLKSTDAQVCINNGTRDALWQAGLIKREHSHVVYNSVDISRFRNVPDGFSARSGLGLPRDALLLGVAGRLVWEKGCADLLSIIERLPAPWHGVICGDGPDRNDLQRASVGRGLGDRIHFLGALDDMVPFYAALDAYAFLSRYEAFGLVMAEAMACGVPVFGIQSDGESNEAAYPLVRDETAEVLRFDRPGDYRLEVPPAMLDQLASRIRRYGEDPELYHPMIARARVWVETCFNSSIQAEALTSVYEYVCGRRGFPREWLAEFYRAGREQAESQLATIDQTEVIAASA